MDIQSYYEKNEKLQQGILDFLDDNNNMEENYQNLQAMFDHQHIKEDIHELKLFLYLINKISKNHHRSPNFFSKIEQILLIFKDEIKRYYKNYDIFKIFKNNKRILLFLMENKILTMEQRIFDKMLDITYQTRKYLKYFTPEIIEQLQTEQVKNIMMTTSYLLGIIPEDFYEKRRKGENDENLNEIIRDDKIEDFITYVNRNNISLTSTFFSSIYETNSLLLKRGNIQLIEYAAFCGSIQIFKYLYLNKVELTPSLWIFAVHGDNPEIIHILEDKKIKPEIKTKKVDNEEEENERYLNVFIECVKCHHNDIANYIYENYLNKDKDCIVMKKCLRFFNFSLLEKKFLKYDAFFYYLCKNDYYSSIDILLKNNKIDVNKIYTKEIKSNNSGIIREEKMTALYISVAHENIEVVKLLLSEENININAEITLLKKINKKTHKDISTNKSFPLIKAVEKGNFEIVKILLMHKNIDANLSSISYYKYEKEKNLNHGLTLKNTQILKYQNCAIHIAVKQKNLEIINLLLAKENIDANIKNESIEYYFDSDPRNSSYDGYIKSKDEKSEDTALTLAINDKSIEVIKLLLSYENIDVNCPSFNSIETKNEVNTNDRNNKSFENCFLIENKMTTEMNSPLDISLENRNFEIAEILLKHKNIDINYKSYYKVTVFTKYRDDCEKCEKINKAPLLYKAVKDKNMKRVQLLLSDKKIDPNLQLDHYKYIEDYYKDRNTDLITKTINKYETPLNLAVTLGDYCLVELLLDNKSIDVNLGMTYKQSMNEPKNVHKTPLHSAVEESNNIDIIKLLLQHENIDLEAKDNKGMTPAQHAKDKNIKKLFNRTRKRIK